MLHTFSQAPRRVLLAVATTLSALALTATAAGAAPVPSFTMSPSSPTAGQRVTFTDTSTAPDGIAIVRRAWDINGDGLFADPNGPVTVSRPYNTAGQVKISLRVTNAVGATTVLTRVLTVLAVGATSPTPTPIPTPTPSPTPTPTPTPAPTPVTTTPVTTTTPVATTTTTTTPPPETSGAVVTAQGVVVPARATLTVVRTPVLTPAPVVRIRGRLFGRFVQIALLTVRAPGGASVRVSCSGAKCPVRMLQRKVGTRAATLRFGGFERRLPAGTVLKVFVTAPGTIGKYTRLTLRRTGAPARLSSCLLTGTRDPSPCPKTA